MRFVRFRIRVIAWRGLGFLWRESDRYRHTGLRQLVVAGGVGANRRLRDQLDGAAARRKATVFYPELALCTDNGAMIAFAGALRFAAGAPGRTGDGAFAVRPRWSLQEIGTPV